MSARLPSGTDRTQATVLIRIDANAAIGAGHAMRCLALAEAWLELGGRVIVATAAMPVSIADCFERAGARVVKIQATEHAATLAREVGAGFAVVDGYHLGASDQHVLAETGARLLVIDDRGETATRSATLVLNQNASASAEMYAHLDAKLLLGTHYALLRRQFRTRPVRSVPVLARRVLVTFGGADPANLTPRALEAIAPLDGIEAVVIAGFANPRAAELRVPVGARAAIRVIPSVDDMAEHMKWADLAVVAAGSTCWELAACGVPMVAVAVAENQIAVTESIAALGFGVPLGREAADVESLRALIVALVHDESKRREMSRTGREVIDGEGALRACVALRDDGDAR